MHVRCSEVHPALSTTKRVLTLYTDISSYCLWNHTGLVIDVSNLHNTADVKTALGLDHVEVATESIWITVTPCHISR